MVLTFGQPRLATSGLTEDTCACAAENNGLCVREDGGDREAACVGGERARGAQGQATHQGT